jgi:hypothetical protein
MNRRAVLGLVGCGVGTAATGRAVALAGCDASADPGAGLVARWVFPAGDYRVGIARGADLAVRLIVFATASEPERTFAIPPPAPRPASPKGRRPAAWASVDTTAEEPAQPGPAGSAMPVVPDVANGGVPEAGEARIVFDDGPGLKTTVDCCGIGIAGKAYAVASVSETGPTYLVRLDPATGRIATLGISRHALDVVALYRRPGQDALCVVVADGRDVVVRNAVG